MSRPIAGLTYQDGEKVLTRFGWGTVENVREETYPEEVTTEVTFECTVRLDQPSNSGDEVVTERNPRKDYRYGVLFHLWNIGDPRTQGPPVVEEFLAHEEEQARSVFESADMTSSQVLLVVFADYQTGRAQTRMLTADGEVVRLPS